MYELTWTVLSGNRRDNLTDEVVVRFDDKVTQLEYQRGTVVVPRRATVEEIAECVNARRAFLEDERRGLEVGQPEVQPLPAIELPKEIVDVRFDAAGSIEG